jgi:transcriptional regulator with XRE-family HTH domain
MDDERRRRFGAYLARLRGDADLSQRQLAAALCRNSGVTSVTRNEISRWERGERLPDTWLPTLADVLGVPAIDLENAAAYARGEPAARLPEPLADLAALLPDDAEQLEPLAHGHGRVVGMDGVAALAARVEALRRADDVLAAGELVGPAFQELAAAVDLFRESTHVDDVGRALLVQVGELAQIAGWIASDAGRHVQAEHAYQLGASAARHAGDAQLLTHVVGSLAYQRANTGQERDAVDLVEAVVAEAGPNIHPTARALALDRVAWARTRAAQPQDAIHALGQAHEALTEAATAGEPAPSWAYWVSDDELRVMDARVMTELHRPLRAVPLLTEVLARYDATHARELALYLSWLAVALADANEPEEAAATAARMLALNVASERAAARARIVLRRLEAFDDVREVRDVLAGHPPA